MDRCRVGQGKFLRGQAEESICKYASWQSSSKPRSGKGTQTDSGVSSESTVENGQQAQQSQRSSLILIKIKSQQTAWPHSVHGWLSHQRPVRAGLNSLSSKVQLPSMKPVQPTRSQAPPWRSLRHYLGAQSRGRHITDLLEERGVERGSARRSSLKGRETAVVKHTNIRTFSYSYIHTNN